jgi:diaminopimelate epimerase
MKFFKYQGTGNDFIIPEGMVERPFLDGEQITAICRRHTGIGADGVIFACVSPGGADAAMRIFNADGSEAEMCGNGIRCLAKYLYERLGMHVKSMTIETAAGARELELSIEDGTVKEVEVDMGLPEFSSGDLPVPDDPSRPGETTIDISAGVNVDAFCLSMGNPHCVLFVDSAADVPVHLLGPELEVNDSFPNRTNVEFAEVENTHRIKLRVWERGVGETRACGTGACAAAVSAIHKGFCGSPVDVDLPGGVLTIGVDGAGHVLMTGPAAEVFCGDIKDVWIY